MRCSVLLSTYCSWHLFLFSPSVTFFPSRNLRIILNDYLLLMVTSKEQNLLIDSTINSLSYPSPPLDTPWHPGSLDSLLLSLDWCSGLFMNLPDSRLPPFQFLLQAAVRTHALKYIPSFNGFSCSLSIMLFLIEKASFSFLHVLDSVNKIL